MGVIKMLEIKLLDNKISIFHIIKQLNAQNSKTLDISSFSMHQTYINSRECPHCGSHHVVSKGNYRGRKRYLCRNCGRSHNNLTNTPFSGIHKLDKLQKYLTCIIDGDSIRKAADCVNVSVSTSFHWRHKLLDSFNKLPPPRMKNVKEIMELKLPFSSKGQRAPISAKKRTSKVSALFACDRTGKLDSDSITYSLRDKNPLLQRIASISDQHSEIIHYSNVIGIKNLNSNSLIKANRSSNYTNAELIIQTVDSWKAWMKRFRGVSTKYLRNYLHWFDFLDNSSLQDDKTFTFLELLFSSN